MSLQYVYNILLTTIYMQLKELYINYSVLLQDVLNLDWEYCKWGGDPVFTVKLQGFSCSGTERLIWRVEVLGNLVLNIMAWNWPGRVAEKERSGDRGHMFLSSVERVSIAEIDLQGETSVWSHWSLAGKRACSLLPTQTRQHCRTGILLIPAYNN